MPSPLPEIDIPVSTLIPIQASLSRIAPSLDRLGDVDLGSMPPVETVAYGDDPDNPTRLLVDGHNRAYITLFQGLEIVRGVIAANDEDLRLLKAASVLGCTSIEAVHERYQREWQPHTRALGVTSVDKIIVVL